MAVLLPFRPNWSKGFSVTLNYLTDIAQFYDGTEQRRAQRAFPRRQFEFSPMERDDRAGEAQIFLSVAGNERFFAADFGRWRRAAAPVASGATSLVLDSGCTWAGAGHRLVVDDGVTQQVLRVASAAGLTLNLVAGPAIAIPQGAKVYSCVESYLDEPQGIVRVTNRAGEFPVSLLEFPGESAKLAPAAWPSTFKGLPLFDHRPDWSSRPRVKVESDREFYDFNKGKVGFTSARGYLSTVYQFGHVGKNRTETEAIFDFFCAMRGRQGEFWLPSWLDDMRLAEDYVSGVVLVAAGDSIVQAATDPTRRHIRIATANGTVLHREVLSMALSGGDTELTLDAALPGALSAGDVTSISWLHRARFASDSASFTWETDSLMTTTLNFTTLREPA
jgi:hypothetical protein